MTLASDSANHPKHGTANKGKKKSPHVHNLTQQRLSARADGQGATRQPPEEPVGCAGDKGT